MQVIGPAGGVSVNTEVWPPKVSALEAACLPAVTNSSRCDLFLANMADMEGAGGDTASQVCDRSEDIKVPVEGGALSGVKPNCTKAIRYSVGRV